jgi:hypothetical protein
MDRPLGPDMALHPNGGKGGPARLPVKQVDDECDHDRTPLLIMLHSNKSRFQAGFVLNEKSFHPSGHRSQKCD